MPRPTSIIDQYGNPISSEMIRRLRTPVAQPSLTSPRGPFSHFRPTERLTPQGLAAILQQSALGQSEQYMQLLEDIEEKDLHYRAVLTTRKLQVAQLPITVEAASEAAHHQEHADFLRRWIDTGALGAALFHMLDAVSKGFSVMEVAWQTEPGAIWPLRLVWRPQRYFEVDWRDGETIMLRQSADFAPLLPHKFIQHRHPTKSGQVLRSGLGRVAVWAWMFKSFTLQDWAIFVRNYGQPVRLGKYGPESSAEDRDVLWRAVSNLAGDLAAIVPASMQMEFIEVGDVSKGSEVYEKRARYMDEQLSKLILGQVATTDAIAGGHAVSQEHRLVQEDIERADAGLLCGTLNRQLVPSLIAFNFGQVLDGLPQIRIGRPDELPIKEVVAAVKDLGPLGLRVRASEIHERLGTTPPEGAEEDVIGGRQPAPVPPPAGGAMPLPGGLPAPGTPPRPILNGLLTLHAQQAPAALEALLDRLSLDTQGALNGLTDAIRVELQAATDMQDLARRIAGLQLPPEELASVLGRGLALANLVGQAAVVDEMRRG